MSKRNRIAVIFTALAALWALCAVAAPVPQAAAAERILRMDASVKVEPDTSIVVTERIVFTAEHREIRRGLIREIPIIHREKGRSVKSTFKVLSLTQDGKPAHHELHYRGRNVEVHLGDDSMLSKGRHEYVLTYRMTEQLIFHDDADELHWNVTGNDWIFPIDKATYHVTLPKGATISEIDAATGQAGAQGKNWRRKTDGSFETTQPLAPGEGFTVMTVWPKGFVTPPTKIGVDAFLDRFGFDNLFAASAALVFLCFFLLWFFVGRDPRRGIIVPAWNPPDDLEPAYLGYVRSLAFGTDLLLSDLIDLAVRGYLTLEPAESSLTVRKTGNTGQQKDWDRLSPPHRKLMETLFAGDATVRRLGGNSSDVGSPDAKFTKALLQRAPGFYNLKPRKSFGGNLIGSILQRLFKNDASPRRAPLVRWNRMAIALGLLSFVPMLLLIGTTVDFDTLDGFPFVVIIIASGIFIKNMLEFFFVVIPGIFRTLRINRKAKRSNGSALNYFMSILSLTLVFAVFGQITLSLVSMFGDFAPASWQASYFLIGCVAFAAASAVFFSWHMHTRTKEGRALLDKVEGFEMYLKTAERHRLEQLYPSAVRNARNLDAMPEQTPQLFERLLPYAFALGVAETWADAYASVLETANYNPEWQHGSNRFNVHTFTTGMRRMESAMRPAPSSSSGSGSGRSGGSSSGGGRGGGGGRGR